MRQTIVRGDTSRTWRPTPNGWGRDWACVRQLSEFFNKSPETITPEELHQYFIHLKTEKKLARQTSTQTICAIKLFWEKTAGLPWPAEVQFVRANPRFKLPVVQKHYVSARSHCQPSILVFLAQDDQSRTFCYSNADLRKGEEAEEIVEFIGFWKKTHGQQPRHLVFDSKLTTYANLGRLDEMKIDFITLRRRTPKLLAEVYGLPRSAWRTVELDVPTRQYRMPRVFEQPVRLAGRTFRQLFITDLGHGEPTILLTNQKGTHKTLITRYARRMLIENSLSDAVRFLPHGRAQFGGRIEGGF